MFYEQYEIRYFFDIAVDSNIFFTYSASKSYSACDRYQNENSNFNAFLYSQLIIYSM